VSSVQNRCQTSIEDHMDQQVCTTLVHNQCHQNECTTRRPEIEGARSELAARPCPHSIARAPTARLFAGPSSAHHCHCLGEWAGVRRPVRTRRAAHRLRLSTVFAIRDHMRRASGAAAAMPRVDTKVTPTCQSPIVHAPAHARAPAARQPVEDRSQLTASLHIHGHWHRGCNWWRARWCCQRLSQR